MAPCTPLHPPAQRQQLPWVLQRDHSSGSVCALSQLLQTSPLAARVVFFLIFFFSRKIFVAVAALRPAPGSGFAAARPQTRSEQLRPWRFPAEPVLQQQHRNSLFLQRCFQGLTTKGFCTKGPRAPLSVSLKSLTFLAKKGNDPAARSAGTSGFYPCHEWVMAVHGPVPDLREGEGDVMHKRPPGRPERGSETGMKILFSQASSAGAGGGEQGTSLGTQGSAGGAGGAPGTNHVPELGFPAPSQWAQPPQRGTQRLLPRVPAQARCKLHFSLPLGWFSPFPSRLFGSRLPAGVRPSPSRVHVRAASGHGASTASPLLQVLGWQQSRC